VVTALSKRVSAPQNINQMTKNEQGKIMCKNEDNNLLQKCVRTRVSKKKKKQPKSEYHY
jgi:hypothetical protein